MWDRRLRSEHPELEMSEEVVENLLILLRAIAKKNSISAGNAELREGNEVELASRTSQV